MTLRVPLWACYLGEVFLSTYGSMMAAAWFVYLAFPVVRLFDIENPITFTHFNRILSEPYFPLQIAMGSIAGGYARHRFKRSLASWVWILPLAHFLFCLATFNVSVLQNPLVVRFDHFLGNGCRPPQCWDQMLCTGPFYTSVAYSLGAWAGKIVGGKSPATVAKVSVDEEPPA
jgi:hypothetical protein